MPSRPEWHLHIGSKFTGIVVRPDERYPSMYRVHWPDRPPSDIVNLPRAKDAAMRWAAGQRRKDQGHRTVGELAFVWKVGKQPAGASSGGFSGEVATV